MGGSKKDADSTRVQNKTPAPIRISAEQILREAESRSPMHEITEPDDYRLRKRENFEDLIRRVGWDKSLWVEYANWEESHKDFTRARAVWVRALEVDCRDHALWLKYADFEINNKSADHARNALDRATMLLPGVDALWYRYIDMEEMVACNVGAARKIFERWMEFMPDQQAWISYIMFELRYNEVDRARSIFKRAFDHLPQGPAEKLYRMFVAFQKQYGIEDARLA